MHLGNSIICPVTGIPMIALMGVTAFWAFKKAKKDLTKDKVLPTVMLTALVFCLQMINFSIPTTASSGHIIGAVLLCAILGPYAAFLSICSILLVQSVFFADGGLLALGCNIFNMGFLACFAAYPIIKKSFANNPIIAVFLASIVALQLGSLAVVIESSISGAMSGAITNSMMFASLMQGIHLAIGFVEGMFSAIVVAIINKTGISKKFSYTMGVLALLLAGVISNYASKKPDGLEWSLLNMPEGFIAQTQGQIYQISESLQAKIAILGTMPSEIGNLLGLAVVALLSFTVFSIMAKKAQA